MMRKPGIYGIAFCAIFLVGCGGNDYEDAMKELVDVFDDMADVLSTIEDEASAKAAEPRMEKLSKRMQELAQVTCHEALSQEEAAAINKKYEPQLMAATERFMNEVMRLMMLEGMDTAMMEGMLAQMNNQGR